MARLRIEVKSLQQQAEEKRKLHKSIESEYKEIKRPKKNTAAFVKKGELKKKMEAAVANARSIREKYDERKKELKSLEGRFGRKGPTGIVSEHATAVEGLFVRMNNALANAARAVNCQGRKAADDPSLPPFQFVAPETPTHLLHESVVAFKILERRLSDVEQDQLSDLVAGISKFRQRGATGRGVLLEVLAEIRARSGLCSEDLAAVEGISEYLSGKSLDVQFRDGNRVFANLMAVAIRDSSPDDLRRLLRKKGIPLAEIAFGLQGALLGFGALPKTFTESWFAEDNSKAADKLDDFLWSTVMPAVFGDYAPPNRRVSEESENGPGALELGEKMCGPAKSL